MQHSQNHQRVFFRRIDEEKISHNLKANRPRRQIWAPMARLRERNECANGIQDFLEKTVGSTGIVSSDIFPNLGKVCEGARMEYEPTHARRRS